MSSFLPDVLVADAMQEAGSEVEHRSRDPGSSRCRRAWTGSTTISIDDGGWGWWQTDDSHPFMTAYVLAGLSQAKAAGFDVKQDAIDKGRAWLLPAVQQVNKVRTRSARVHGLCAGAQRQRQQRASPRFGVVAASTLTAYGKAVLGLAMLQLNDSRAKDLTTQARRRSQAGRLAGLVAERPELPDGLLWRHDCRNRPPTR